MDSDSGLGRGLPAQSGSVSTFGRCPTHWLIRQLADRWSLPVMSALRSSPKRFTELLQILAPVSRRMLDRTLKKLMLIGLVRRTALPVPNHVGYELTDLGRSLELPLGRLIGWSHRHIIDTLKGGRSFSP
jgi:DNA-binding HxlR family transcriptional regulator